MPWDRRALTGSKVPRIDWIGGFLVTSGLSLFMFSLTQSGVVEKGWSEPCKSFPVCLCKMRLIRRCAGRIRLINLPAHRISIVGTTSRKQDFLPPNSQVLPLHTTSLSFHGVDAMCILLYNLDIWIRIHSDDLVSGTKRRDAIEECYFVITL
jgi:hypothetical protein